AATDGVTIQNNLIHGLSNSNPNSLRYSYSYGVWAVGGGTVPSRGAITGLQILNNRIFDLGGSAVYNGFSGGAGVFVFSTVGATAGAGVIVTGNRLEDLPGGTHNVYGTQPGLGVAVLSDESGADDTGGLVTGNSYINIPMGVTMQVGNSTVSETNASFSGATVFVLNISSLAVIDEISLQPYASSTSPSLGFFSAPSGSIAYFPSAQAAFDNSTSAATVTIHGNLSGVGTATATRIFLDGGQMVIVQNGVEIFRGTPGGVTSVVVLGTSGNDTLEINLDLLGLIGASGIVFNAGLGFDSITLVGGTGLTTVEHVFENENDGRVEVDGNLIVTYTGLDPIIDLLVAVNRIFTFTAGSETVVMSDDGIIGNGFSFIDGDSAESVTYRNPSATLVVNLGLGNDTVTLTELDSGLTIDPVLNGNAGNDRFNITPSANYNVFVFGGTPTVAPGDALDIDLAGATGAVLTNLGGTGNWSFTNRETIFFQEIETQIDDPTQTDLAISKWMSSSTAIAGDIVVFTVAVTNNGVATASGVEVTDVLPATLTCICAEVISEGAFGSTGGSGATLTWSGVGLASGETATLSYQVLVGLAASGTGTNTATITAVSPADVNPLDNSATASITFDRPIRFPTNTVVQAIDFYVNALGVVETFVGTHNAGLYRNIPGYIGGRWTLVEDDLPTNLFVNDILVSSSGITYVATAGWGGLHTSSNGGRSYTPVDFGGPTLTTVYAIDESPVDGTIFISADDGQVWRLVGGAYWDFAGRLPGGASHTPWTFATDPTVAGRVYAGTFGDGVYRSNDYGESWTKVSGPAMPNDGSIHVFDLEFDPELSPSTLWAGTSRGIFFSQDSGVTWNDASSGLGQFKEVRSIAFGPEDSSPTETGSMYVATWGGGVFELPSDRSTLPLWVPVTLRNQQIGIVAVSPDGTSLVVGPAGGGTETVAIGSSVSTSADKPVEIPSAVSLNQNYPNPFNPRTTISFGLPASGRVTLTVHDVVGRQVATLIDGVVPGGQHEVGFNAGALPSGPYIYRLRTEAGSLDKVMLLLK
ncbi:MAG: putative repeat protein (TIGR01451 family), partial [Thalassolituus oleivorans]